MGVVSAVDERSRSLTAGEKCRGGGVSRESSFTEVWLLLTVEGGGGGGGKMWVRIGGELSEDDSV